MILSERTDVNKANGSSECIIYHYCYFLKIYFRFQPKECNGCHDLMEKAINFEVRLSLSKKMFYLHQ